MCPVGRRKPECTVAAIAAQMVYEAQVLRFREVYLVLWFTAPFLSTFVFNSLDGSRESDATTSTHFQELVERVS